MGLKELFSALRKEGIPPDWYLIGDEGISECRTCMRRIDGRWAVYFSEHGLKSALKFHDSESEACRDLLSRMLREKELRGSGASTEGGR